MTDGLSDLDLIQVTLSGESLSDHNDMTTILCLAYTFKGVVFLEEAKLQNCRTILLTRERYRDCPWPWASIDEFHALEDFEDALPFVCELAKQQTIDFVFGLHERDVDRAAIIREHLCLPGMTRAVANAFRDKLCMRELTQLCGIPNPAFVHVLQYQTINEYIQRIPAPWMLKPRAEAGAIGIVRIDNANALWDAIHRLGDEASHYLLEERLHGDVYHVDSLVHRGKVCFAQPHRYRTPPFEVWNRGGVFRTASLACDDPVYQKLLELNSAILSALGLDRGVTHVEFIECSRGQLFFLEAAARVGGANIDVLVEKATRINLWREWLKLELRADKYRIPKRRQDCATLLQCLARSKHPDLSNLTGPEIVWKLNLDQHAGLIVAGVDATEVDLQADRCQEELASNHLAILPPPKSFR